MFPVESKTMPTGPLIVAAVAAPPSPVYPPVPVPTTVLMSPEVETFRMRLLPASAIYRFLPESSAVPPRK
jgi:hypothetical protein